MRRSVQWRCSRAGWIEQELAEITENSSRITGLCKHRIRMHPLFTPFPHVHSFPVNDRIHEFHNGASRDLYRQYSESLPWLGVSRAFFDRVLTDDDLMDTSDEVRAGITEFAASFAKLEAERETAVDDDR